MAITVGGFFVDSGDNKSNAIVQPESKNTTWIWLEYGKNPSKYCQTFRTGSKHTKNLTIDTSYSLGSSDVITNVNTMTPKNQFVFTKINDEHMAVLNKIIKHLNYPTKFYLSLKKSTKINFFQLNPWPAGNQNSKTFEIMIKLTNTFQS